jgi:ketosteroid isomerase-like protein
MNNYSKNIQTVLAILQDEANGDISSALKKMSEDYSMTWVYMGRDAKLFPSSSPNFQAEMKEDIYPIRNREYRIKNIGEGENVVFVEMIESYPDPETGKLYQTPLVLVLEMKEGEIRTGRHYCDPRISHENLPTETLQSLYKNDEGGDITVIRDQR